MNLIPYPKKLTKKDGVFKIDKKTKLAIGPDVQVGLVNDLKAYINDKLGLEIAINKSDQDKVIRFIKKECKDLYQLEISETSVDIISSSDKGLFYGLQSLKQVIGLNKRHLPCLKIYDSPTFQARGFYHDVTRGKVPSLDQLKKLVDIMASFKLNQLQLYIEHTYLFKGQSEVWSITDPLTAEEIILLDDYCVSKHIELVPSISTFGHLYEVLQSETYKDLCEIETLEGFSFVDRMNHHTLNVSLEGSFDLVKSMIDDFIPLVRSNKFNICADETFDLGEGKNKALSESLGKSKLYVDFLLKIIDYVKSYNKEVMFWGDIIIKYPEHIEKLPEDLICLNWWYWLNYPEEKVKIIADQGFSQYMCPGVNGWNTLMNNHQMAYDNIKLMTDYGKKYEAIGILNTDWGDYGHWNFLSNSIPGLIYGAAFSWGEDRDYVSLNQAIDNIYFDAEVMSLLDKVSKCHYFTLLPLVQWMEKGQRTYFDRIDVSDKELTESNENLEGILETLHDVLAQVPAERRHDIHVYMVSIEGIIMLNDLYKVIAVELDQAAYTIMTSYDGLAQAFEYWLLDFKALWLKENKPSELYRVVAFIQKVCRWLRTVKNEKN